MIIIYLLYISTGRSIGCFDYCSLSFEGFNWWNKIKTILFFAESPIKSKDLDLSLYSTKQLSPDYRIHWRILKEKNEIEIIAVVNGTSWVGLGWRPRQLNSTCRNFPLIQGDTTSQQLIKPTSGDKENIPSTGNN